MTDYTIVIIGAGAAGIGFGAALRQFNLNDFLILEQGQIGDSFTKWPKTTRFITPSFPTNGFGFPDLNAVVPDTSPAFTFEKEHLSGSEYANYLQRVAAHYTLPIKTQTPVTAIEKQADHYQIQTDTRHYSAKYVIMATGEFQNPNSVGIKNAHLGMHYGQIDSFQIKSEQPFLIIGGNESACDALTHLAYLGNEVHLFTDHFGQNTTKPDPSISLAPITKEHLASIKAQAAGRVFITEHKTAQEITYSKGTYTVVFSDGSLAKSSHQPILATGFAPSFNQIAGAELFEKDQHGLPLVTEQDESTRYQNCFLIGPSLRHGETIFCYIYKFRQRFAPIIREIAQREKLPIDKHGLAFYQANQMYLDDLSCCQVNCDC